MAIRESTKQKYFEAFARHASGEHIEEIAQNLGVTPRSVYSALRWVSENRLTLEPPDRLALAICEKRAHLKHLAHKRAELEAAKAWNGLIGLERLLCKVHSEVLELEGVKAAMERDDCDYISELDITINTHCPHCGKRIWDDVEEWEQKHTIGGYDSEGG